MDFKVFTRSSTLYVAAVLSLFVICCSGTFASEVHTYIDKFNLRIPQDEGKTKGKMADAILEINDHYMISDLDVEINLIHSSAFDLQIFLQSPSGTRICLNYYDFDKEFLHGQDYVETIFDDEADTPIEEGSPPFTGRFQLVEPFKLSAFDGEDIYGQWQLQIYDMWYDDVGSFGEYKLYVTTPEPASIFFLMAGIILIRLKKTIKACL